MIISGEVWKYGDNVNTDVIFPGRYTYVLLEESYMGQYALEDLDPLFNSSSKAGDIIVAGRNWGCGSAREQAVKCLKARGVGAIIAESFSRIYYRNCLNEGLLTIVCPELVNEVEQGDILDIDVENSIIRLNNKEYHFTPYPSYVKGLIESGGLIPYVKKKLAVQECK